MTEDGRGKDSGQKEIDNDNKRTGKWVGVEGGKRKEESDEKWMESRGQRRWGGGEGGKGKRRELEHHSTC